MGSVPDDSVMPASHGHTTMRDATQHAIGLIRKHPLLFVAGVAAAVFTIAVLSRASSNATLKVQMQYSFRSAQVSVWVDGDLACTQHIAGTARRRFGLIPSGIGGNFSRVLPLSAGRHTVKVRVTSEDGYDNSGSSSGDFPENTQTVLQVNPRRSGNLGMSWQGSSTLVADSGPAWYVKYGSSLLMTAVGSLVSALMAYIVKELPNLLRRTSTPKA